MKKKMAVVVAALLVLMVMLSSCSSIMGITWLSGVWKLFGPIVLLSEERAVAFAEARDLGTITGELELNSFDGTVYFGVLRNLETGHEYQNCEIVVVGDSVKIFTTDGGFAEGTIINRASKQILMH